MSNSKPNETMIRAYMDLLQRCIDDENEEAFLHWRVQLQALGVITGRLHRKSDGSWWRFPKLTADEARQYLLERVELTDEDLTDPMVRDALWKTVGRMVEREPVNESMSWSDAESVRYARDISRQLRKIKPLFVLVDDSELREMQRLYETSTPGTYTLCQGGECSCGMVWALEGDCLVHLPPSSDASDIIPDLEHRKADARFIALAHNLMPRLIFTIQKLRETQNDA